METCVCQVNSFFPTTKASSHLTAPVSCDPPVLFHMTSHRAGCPGVAGADLSFFLFDLTAVLRAAPLGLFRPRRPSILSASQPVLFAPQSKQTASFWSRLTLLFWKTACHYSLSSAPGLLRQLRCWNMNVKVLQFNQHVTEKNCKVEKRKKKEEHHEKATVLHYNQYYSTPNVNKKEL